MKVVILAGGSGTRLWPLSRSSKPKQVMSIIGTKTLLQQTYKRLRLGFDAQDILVVTGKSHAQDVMHQLPQLPKENIFIEPVRRDSAGAIGLVASCIYARNPKEILISVHSDSWIDDDKKFIDLLYSSESIIKKYPDHTIMFGISPIYPETGYGYIQVHPAPKKLRSNKKNDKSQSAWCGVNTKIVQRKFFPVYSVKQFIEKPSLARARKFAADKKYFWNPGWFVWRVDNLMSLYKKYLPKNFSILTKISSAPRKKLQSAINKEFPKLKSESIDYGIHEKTKKIFVVPACIRWTDIGHFRNVAEMSDKDKDGNTVHGKSVLLESRNNFLMSSSGKLITAVGINNLAMIETDDVILLIDKDHAQDVKKIVEQINKKGMKKYL
ncbi:hypothetical protein KKF64_00805 [Patescibacteria group bacterium]|nr:hypothetical protein [Patescibacteria group bacterium]